MVLGFRAKYQAIRPFKRPSIFDPTTKAKSTTLRLTVGIMAA